MSWVNDGSALTHNNSRVSIYADRYLLEMNFFLEIYLGTLKLFFTLG